MTCTPTGLADFARRYLEQHLDETWIPEEEQAYDALLEKWTALLDGAIADRWLELRGSREEPDVPEPDRADDSRDPAPAAPDTSSRLRPGPDAGYVDDPWRRERTLGQCYRELKAILDEPLPDAGLHHLLADIAESAREQ